MRLVVDTGVFSAALSRRRRAHLDEHVARLAGHQLFLAVVTVAELRYGIYASNIEVRGGNSTFGSCPQR